MKKLSVKQRRWVFTILFSLTVSAGFLSIPDNPAPLPDLNGFNGIESYQSELCQADTATYLTKNVALQWIYEHEFDQFRVELASDPEMIQIFAVFRGSQPPCYIPHEILRGGGRFYYRIQVRLLNQKWSDKSSPAWFEWWPEIPDQQDLIKVQHREITDEINRSGQSDIVDKQTESAIDFNQSALSTHSKTVKLFAEDRRSEPGAIVCRIPEEQVSIISDKKLRESGRNQGNLTIIPQTICRRYPVMGFAQKIFLTLTEIIKSIINYVTGLEKPMINQLEDLDNMGMIETDKEHVLNKHIQDERGGSHE